MKEAARRFAIAIRVLSYLWLAVVIYGEMQKPNLVTFLVLSAPSFAGLIAAWIISGFAKEQS